MQVASLGLELLQLSGEGQVVLLLNVVGVASGGHDRVTQLSGFRAVVALGGLERSELVNLLRT